MLMLVLMLVLLVLLLLVLTLYAGGTAGAAEFLGVAWLHLAPGAEGAFFPEVTVTNLAALQVKNTQDKDPCCELLK